MTRTVAEHLVDDVLAWWQDHGVDEERGGVRTGFDNAGGLRTSDRFTWSQGRWAWLAGELADEADAGRLPVDAHAWRRRCVLTCTRLVGEAVRPDHRTHARLTEDAEPVSDADGQTATSVFADLFCVLGLSAGLRQLDADDPRREEWSAVCDDVLTAARDAIAAGDAPSDPYPVPEGFTDLAGPMTLLHTAAEVLRSPTTKPDAARGVRDWAAERLATVHLADGRWREFATDDPSLADTLLARHVTPGHLLELLWMIEHAEASDDGFTLLTPQERAELARRALAVGWDDEAGGVLRYVDRDGGRPRGEPVPGAPYEQLVTSTWDTKLWWVHVEAWYGLSLLATTAPDADARATLAEGARRVAAWTMRTFPEPDAEWLQIRDRAGAPLDQVVALPVKDPFHIARALLLLNRLDPHAVLPTKE